MRGNKVKKVFIINNRVRFDPHSRTLTSIDTSDNTVQLHTPACECLLLLLIHNGETLSHTYLSEEVWIKKGSYVTTNSLYQNIAAIRRGLKAVGLEEDILKTVPKLGFQIYASIDEEQLPLFNGRKVDACDELNESKILVASEAPPLPHAIELATEKKGMNIRLKLIFLLLTLIFISGLFFAYQQFRNEDQFFAAYNPVGVINQCDLYSSYPDKEKSKATFLTIIKSGDVNCPQGGKAYLTFNLNNRLSSILLCEKRVEDVRTDCRTVVYSGVVNEKL